LSNLQPITIFGHGGPSSTRPTGVFLSCAWRCVRVFPLWDVKSVQNSLGAPQPQRCFPTTLNRLQTNVHSPFTKRAIRRERLHVEMIGLWLLHEMVHQEPDFTVIEHQFMSASTTTPLPITLNELQTNWARVFVRSVIRIKLPQVYKMCCG